MNIIKNFLKNIIYKFVFIAKLRPKILAAIENNIIWEICNNSIKLSEGGITYEFNIDEVWNNSIDYNLEINLRCMFVKCGISSAIMCVGHQGQENP